MTNEKMLEKMYALYNMIQEDTYVRETEIKPLIEQLKEDIRKDCQKKNGNAKRDKLVEKVMKGNVMARSTWREKYTPYDGMCAFINPYRLYCVKDSFGHEAATEKDGLFNVGAVKPKENNIRMHIDVADVKAFLKDQKAQGKGKRFEKFDPYILSDGDYKIGFNPQYLLEFCEMFDCDYIWCKRPIDPAIYESDNGEWGVILPMRIVEA